MHQEHNPSAQLATIQRSTLLNLQPICQSLCAVSSVVVWFVGWFCLALISNRDSLYPGPCNNREKKTLQQWWWGQISGSLSSGGASVKPLCHQPLWSLMEPSTPLATRASNLTCTTPETWTLSAPQTYNTCSYYPPTHRKQIKKNFLFTIFINIWLMNSS